MIARRRNLRPCPCRLAFTPRLLLAISLATLPASAAATRQSTPAVNSARVVRAHGNDDRYWLIQVEDVTGDKGPKKQGRIYRRASGEEFWRHIGTIDSDVVAMGSRVTQLAMLTPDGSWLLLSDETATTGPALPNGAKLLAFGTDGGTLWAIGEPPPATPSGSAASKPSTRGAGPTSAAATPASGPATAPGTTGPSTSPATAPANGAPAETQVLAL
jgi:hypothetical protein